MSTRTITDCKKLIGETPLPYQILRVNGIYRLVDLRNMPIKKIKPSDRKISPAIYAEPISDVDTLYKRLTAEAEEVAAAIETARGENLTGLSDEELAKHMSKPEEGDK